MYTCMQELVPIEINVDGRTFDGVLDPVKNPQTVEAVAAALPFENRPQTWGKELYFEIPVNMGTERPDTVVSVGTLAYWPEGNAFCMFYGATPASENSRPRAAGPVNVIGQFEQAPQLVDVGHVSEIQVVHRNRDR